MEGGGCVGVDPIVGFDDHEAFVVVVGGAKGGVETGGGAAESARVRGQGGCQPSGVVAIGVRGVLVDDAEISEVEEHLELGVGEVGFAVALAELEAAEHEEEGKDVDAIHTELSLQRNQRTIPLR